MASSINASTTSGIVQTADTSGILNLQTANTTAVTIDASQNVGIGVTPSAWKSTWKAIDISTTSSLVAAAAGNPLIVDNGYVNSANSWIYKTTKSAGQYQIDGNIHYWFTAPSGTAGNPITWTQAMTLDASSNLTVAGTTFTLGAGGAAGLTLGNTTSYTAIASGGTGATLYMNGATRVGTAGGTAAPGAIVFANNETVHWYNSNVNVLKMKLDNSGNLTISGATATKASGTTWVNPSDIRLKDNVTDYSKGLAELMQVNVKEWTYNGKGGTTEGMKGLGVIADEIMTVLPDTVDNYQAKLNADDEADTDIKKFDATEITWLMLNAIKEQQALITSLTARLEVLENK